MTDLQQSLQYTPPNLPARRGNLITYFQRFFRCLDESDPGDPEPGTLLDKLKLKEKKDAALPYISPPKYHGNFIDAAEYVRLTCREPISVAELMRIKLHALHLLAAVLQEPYFFTKIEKQEVYDYFRTIYNTPVTTGDAAFFENNGDLGISLSSTSLRSVKRGESRVSPSIVRPRTNEGALILADIDSSHPREEIIRGFNLDLTREFYSLEYTIEKDKILKTLARQPGTVPRNVQDEKHLLRNFARAIWYLSFITYDNKVIRWVGVDPEYEADNTIRPWAMSGVPKSYSTPVLSGGTHLEDDTQVLVGKTLDAPKLSIPSTLTMDEIIEVISGKNERKKVRFLLS